MAAISTGALHFADFPITAEGGRQRELCTAAASGDVATIARLARVGFNVTAHDNQALKLALYQGQGESMRALIAAGASIHADSWGEEALSSAIHSMRETPAPAMTRITLLLTHGVSVHHRDDDYLFSAALRGRAEVCELLINFGADRLACISFPGRDAIPGGRKAIEMLATRRFPETGTLSDEIHSLRHVDHAPETQTPIISTLVGRSEMVTAGRRVRAMNEAVRGVVFRALEGAAFARRDVAVVAAAIEGMLPAETAKAGCGA